MTQAFLFYLSSGFSQYSLLQNSVDACIFLMIAIISQSDFSSKEVQSCLDRRWR